MFFMDSNPLFFAWIMMLALVVYCYFVTYFGTEILTRKDFDLDRKTKWQLANIFFPVGGNVAYYFFGSRESATF